VVKRLALSAAAALVLLQAAASRAGEAVAVTDDAGRTVRLAQPAHRIVALSPHLTELLFEAGAGQAIAGTVAYSDHPQAARAIPRVGDARALDLERIVTLRPDLVIAWLSGSPRRQVARLEALGIAVFYSETPDLDGIASTLERFGRLTGTDAAASARAQRFRHELAALRARHAGDVPLRVFYQVAAQPLVTVSTRHVIAAALAVCGARSVFSAHRDWLPRPTREAVLLSDPDAVVAAAGAGEGAAALAQWQRWPGLRAVAAGRLYTVDPDLLHRPTPRILAGVAGLCSQLDRARTPPAGRPPPAG
jgi:iron complex transport system substrate-binding protein